MSAAEDIIYTLVASDPSLVARFGSRVFPEVAPKDTVEPYLVYHRMGSANDATSHSGFDELTEPVYQITGWSSQAKVRKLLRGELLDAFRIRRVTVSGVSVVVAVQDDRDLDDDGPPRLFGACLDVSVSF